VAAVQFIQKLAAGLMSLGMRRLAALGIVGVTVFVLVGAGGYFLSRPAREVLYAGLDAADVSRIGAVLKDAGIAFDVSVDGDTVLVDYGKTAQARMLLAEKGLPKSDHAGYELFDKLGSLGLTSFMQQVTKVRALEGELARTIQLLNGVKAARVHLVLRNEGTFRTAGETPSASVVIRTDADGAAVSAQAIRHLVAAAIPGLAASQVTIMNTDGTLLSTSDDAMSAAPEKLIGLERALSRDIEERIATTLAPYLGVDNFRISVAAKLNADRRQTSETDYDPNSRVERSVRTIKESGEAQNSSGQEPVSVEQNIPQEASPAASGDKSREKKDKREELTNYEISSKSVSVTSEGYQIDRLSVAIVINRDRLAAALGENAADGDIGKQLAELEQLAASAAGLNSERGDRIKVTAVDFLNPDGTLEPAAAEGIGSLLLGNLGNFINVVAMVLVSLMVLLLGLKPALKAILAAPPPPAPQEYTALPASAASLPVLDSRPAAASVPVDPSIEALARQISSHPRDRLAKIVELDTGRAALVLKEMLNASAKNAA
jgi:flagellar M-ring protein FliF